jgi:THO complex subunit 3
MTQTNRTIFAPTQPSKETYTILIAVGSGIVKICSYPKNPTTSPPSELTVLTTIQAHTSSCTTLRLSPNGRFLATGGSDAMVNLFDTQELTCVRGLDRPVGSVRNVSFSWDGHFIVAGSDEGTGIDIAHAETGEYLHRVETNVSAQCVAWHPSRYWIAWAGEPGGLKIIGAAGGQL